MAEPAPRSWNLSKSADRMEGGSWRARELWANWYLEGQAADGTFGTVPSPLDIRCSLLLDTHGWSLYSDTSW